MTSHNNICTWPCYSSPQDCPLESGDFRAQQCSAHNDIKYQGATYDWVPAPYDPSAPCILQCQAKGRSLTVELAPKVLDGTRCRADALDMCINGVCQVRGHIINHILFSQTPTFISLNSWVCGNSAMKWNCFKTKNWLISPHNSPWLYFRLFVSYLCAEIHNCSSLLLCFAASNVFPHIVMGHDEMAGGVGIWKLWSLQLPPPPLRAWLEVCDCITGGEAHV